MSKGSAETRNDKKANTLRSYRCVEYIDAQSLNEFFEIINAIWHHDSATGCKYVFRGQADSRWEIVPRIHREDYRKTYFIDAIAPCISNRDIVQFEFRIIKKLIDQLSQDGQDIPNEEQVRLDHTNSGELNFFNKITRGEVIWPPKEFHAVLAIAQHYGLPTRLVDWTYNPLFAIYFASIENVSKATDELMKQSISVYAMRENAHPFKNYDFNKNEYDPWCFGKPLNQFYQFVKTPKLSNDYIKAQNGLFYMYVSRFWPNANDDFVPLSMEQYLEQFSDVKIKKISLPASYSKELVEYLGREFIHAGKLFPGLSGSIKAVKDYFILESGKIL